MNDDLEFETRLRRLKPARVSTRLQRDVDRQLRSESQPRRPPAPGLAAVLVPLAALLLTAILIGRSNLDRPARDRGTPSANAIAAAALVPTLWQYQQAAASPEALDALLDLQARTMPAVGQRMEPRQW